MFKFWFSILRGVVGSVIAGRSIRVDYSSGQLTSSPGETNLKWFVNYPNIFRVLVGEISLLADSFV